MCLGEDRASLRRSWPVGEGEEELQVEGRTCAVTLRTEELGLFMEQ